MKPHDGSLDPKWMTLQPQTTQLETYTSYHIVPNHPIAGVITVIIRELYQRHMVVPTTFEVNYTRSQHFLQCVNGALCLPIILNMKGSNKIHLRAQAFLERSLEM